MKIQKNYLKPWNDNLPIIEDWSQAKMPDSLKERAQLAELDRKLITQHLEMRPLLREVSDEVKRLQQKLHTGRGDSESFLRIGRTIIFGLLTGAFAFGFLCGFIASA